MQWHDTRDLAGHVPKTSPKNVGGWSKQARHSLLSTPQAEEHYTYDAVGNPISSQIGGQSQPNWQYNVDNQLTQWGQANEQTTLTDSASGQTQTQTRAGQNTIYSYNAADRLA